MPVHFYPSFKFLPYNVVNLLYTLVSIPSVFPCIPLIIEVLSKLELGLGIHITVDFQILCK